MFLVKWTGLCSNGSDNESVSVQDICWFLACRILLCICNAIINEKIFPISFQRVFGSDDGTAFKMFDSADYSGSNLLFKDSTQSLVDVGNQDTYDKWLSEEYVQDLEALYCEYTGAAPSRVSISLWTVTFALILQGLWVRALASK